MKIIDIIVVMHSIIWPDKVEIKKKLEMGLHISHLVLSINLFSFFCYLFSRLSLFDKKMNTDMIGVVVFVSFCLIALITQKVVYRRYRHKLAYIYSCKSFIYRLVCMIICFLFFIFSIVCSVCSMGYLLLLT